MTTFTHISEAAVEAAAAMAVPAPVCPEMPAVVDTNVS